jgi:hypothetical protein
VMGMPQPNVVISGADTVWAGIPGQLTIKVENNGNGVLSTTNLSVDSPSAVQTSSGVLLGAIPPFGSTTQNFSLKTSPFLPYQKVQLTINVGDQKYIKEVTIQPIFIFQFFPYGLIAGGVVLGVLYLSLLGFHIHRKRKKATTA